MKEENTRSRRSVLRTSGAALVAATSGLAAMGTASAHSEDYFGEGQRVVVTEEDAPAWFDGKPCETETDFGLNKGVMATCQNDQQSLSCADFVKIGGHDLHDDVWVHVGDIRHDNIPNTSSPKQSDSGVN